MSFSYGRGKNPRHKFGQPVSAAVVFRKAEPKAIPAMAKPCHACLRETIKLKGIDM